MEFVGDGVIVFYDAGGVDLLFITRKLEQTSLTYEDGSGGYRLIA